VLEHSSTSEPNRDAAALMDSASPQLIWSCNSRTSSKVLHLRFACLSPMTQSLVSRIWHRVAGILAYTASTPHHPTHHARFPAHLTPQPASAARRPPQAPPAERCPRSARAIPNAPVENIGTKTRCFLVICTITGISKKFAPQRPPSSDEMIRITHRPWL
jgi:hypothetical protein